MTNEEAKLKVIKNAYGEHWDMVKDHVDENGWVDNKKCNHFDQCGIYDNYIDIISNDREWDDYEIIKWRIPQLREIENNNGWIRVNSVDDLPKDDDYFWVIRDNEIVDMENWEIALSYHNRKDISHYQQITKPKPPIY